MVHIKNSHLHNSKVPLVQVNSASLSAEKSDQIPEVGGIFGGIYLADKSGLKSHCQIRSTAFPDFKRLYIKFLEYYQQKILRA